VREHELYLTASIGMAMYPTDETGPDELLRSAGVAMYRAKEFGGNTFQYYRSDMNVRAMERLATEAALHQALGNKELRLRFQPQVDLQSGRPDGAEVLMRWDRPGHGLVPPKEFIPLMEESGLILSTGEWLLTETLQQVQTWRAAGMAALRISVNLSGRQFNDPALIDSVHRVLDESGVEPGLVEFEITETTLMQDVDRAIATMLYFKTLGIQLAIDDFGTGYSSLAYLKNLPVSTLKLDRSFVHGIGRTDKGNTAIVRSTIDLAHNLGLEVVAEGVDNAGEYRLLKEFGCDRAQGNFIAPPLAASEFPAWLIGHDPSDSARWDASQGDTSAPPAK
jgi:EAL domain-containing protein (putative c-di-GMP-specific phosphodiesterase class I)